VSQEVLQNDPTLTEGDNELKRYLDPFVRQAGINFNQLGNEQATALTQDAVEVVG
jgi:hypothetical protein